MITVKITMRCWWCWDENNSAWACSSYVAYYIRDQMTHPRWYHWANQDLANSVLRTHLLFFLLSTFFFFSHIKQHSIQNITKQNNRHILNISKSNQKGGSERRTIKTQKSLLYIIMYIKQKTLPSVNGRRPGPTDSRRCTFTSHYLQEAMDPICLSTHVWCKPVLNYCLLRSCKTSKQHSLLHWTNTETRIIIKKTQTWVNRPINSQ